MSGPPPVPPKVELPPEPPHDGNILELSLGKLTGSLTWLFESVNILSRGMAQLNAHLEAQNDMWARLAALENRKPEPVVIQERAKTPVIQRAPTPPKIEIPHVPNDEEIGEIAKRYVMPLVDEEVEKVLKKLTATTERLPPLEEFCARVNPWDKMQTYMQEHGFLPYGEPEEKDPCVILGQLLVLIRQDIAMCPKIKDLEDAKIALSDRITEVESFAAADREARSQAAAAESAKIREDLEACDALVQDLINKRLEDGDVAGGLRDVTHRVDMMEERRFPKLESRVRALEDAEHEAPTETTARKKGFLESLAEVDVQEEVRRLRGMVECMEAAMPYETRQTMQFFRETGQVPGANTAGGGGTAAGGGATSAAAGGSEMTMNLSGGVGGGADDIELSSFRMETENQLEKHKQAIEREQKNLMRNLKNNEKKLDQLETQVLDVYKKLPKVLAVLEPLQSQLEMFMNAEPQDSMGGTGGPQSQLEQFGAAPPSGYMPQAMPVAGTYTSVTTQVVTTQGVYAPVAAAPAAVAPVASPTPAADESNTAASTAVAPATDAAPGAQPAATPAQAAADGNSTAAAIPAPAPAQAPVPSSGGAIAPLPNVAAVGQAVAQVPAVVPQAATGQPAVSPAPGRSIVQSPQPNKMAGMGAMPLAAAGKGDIAASPMMQMGSLTNLIKVALQSTTNDIQFSLRQEMFQFRSELLGGLDGKANKSELMALSSRLDAIMQKRAAAREKSQRFAPALDRERSSSPRSEQADTTKDMNRSWSQKMASFDGASPPAAKLLAGSASPPIGRPSHSHKHGTCHDRCKEPTAPRTLQMTQSLSRLPALKTVQ